MLTETDLQAQAVELTSKLIRFNTVNPPGNERPLLEWLERDLTEAGFSCEIVFDSDPARANLVASIAAEDRAAGPVLGYLSHVDTVLADPADWEHDPWSGEVHDGFLWGRGALDMKSQTGAEVAAALALVRGGWRPQRGELKLLVVCDEETGGKHGAQWLTEKCPDLVRCDMLLNEGGGSVMPFGDRNLYGVCVAEKGTLRFSVRTKGRAGHASCPGLADSALLKLVPLIDLIGSLGTAWELTDAAQLFLQAVSNTPDFETSSSSTASSQSTTSVALDPSVILQQIRKREPRLAAMVEPTLGITFAPTRVFASEKINVIPAHADVYVDSRLPPGVTGDVALNYLKTELAKVVGPDDYEIEVLEEVIGNESPADSELMRTIKDWVKANDPAGQAVPSMLPAFTDSRWFRGAFPDCTAYGFFPMRYQNSYDSWPLVHSANERIDIRDLGFATRFFVDTARSVLGE